MNATEPSGLLTHSHAATTNCTQTSAGGCGWLRSLSFRVSAFPFLSGESEASKLAFLSTGKCMSVCVYVRVCVCPCVCVCVRLHTHTHTHTAASFSFISSHSLLYSFLLFRLALFINIIIFYNIYINFLYSCSRISLFSFSLSFSLSLLKQMNLFFCRLAV